MNPFLSYFIKHHYGHPDFSHIILLLPHGSPLWTTSAPSPCAHPNSTEPGRLVIRTKNFSTPEVYLCFLLPAQVQGTLGPPSPATLPFNSALVCLALGSFSVDSLFISLFWEQQPLQKERVWALRTSTALPFLQCDLGQVTSPAGSTDGEREYLNKYK